MWHWVQLRSWRPPMTNDPKSDCVRSPCPCGAPLLATRTPPWCPTTKSIRHTLSKRRAGNGFGPWHISVAGRRRWDAGKRKLTQLRPFIPQRGEGAGCLCKLCNPSTATHLPMWLGPHSVSQHHPQQHLPGGGRWRCSPGAGKGRTLDRAPAVGRRSLPGGFSRSASGGHLAPEGPEWRHGGP
jgi:hypothetical protein